MASFWGITFGKPSYAGPENRQAGRVRTEMLTCNLGHIEDLSVTGARISCRRLLSPKCKKQWVVFIPCEGGKLRLKAQIVRVVRHGAGRFEVGLNFLKSNPQVRERLTGIVRNYSARTMVDARPYDRPPDGGPKGRDDSGGQARNAA
ncbi:MAG: PilZ domain-containing protein [Phycisphaeraceae bacterium]|nr:PilZ domain-containing protein [Phycisphaeraceae bacterium]